jgi:hypothetical protein
MNDRRRGLLATHHLCGDLLELRLLAARGVAEQVERAFHVEPEPLGKEPFACSTTILDVRACWSCSARLRQNAASSTAVGVPSRATYFGSTKSPRRGSLRIA